MDQKQSDSANLSASLIDSSGQRQTVEADSLQDLREDITALANVKQKRVVVHVYKDGEKTFRGSYATWKENDEGQRETP